MKKDVCFLEGFILYQALGHRRLTMRNFSKAGRKNGISASMLTVLCYSRLHSFLTICGLMMNSLVQNRLSIHRFKVRRLENGSTLNIRPSLLHLKLTSTK